jgi:hypothetical protein
MGEPLVVNRRNISYAEEAAMIEKAEGSQVFLEPGEVFSFSPPTHIHGKPTVTPNVNKVRVCKGCYCVYFEHELHTYICGVIRTGVRHPGRTVQDHVFAALFGGRPLRQQMRMTKGCSKQRKDKSLPDAPPTSSVTDLGIFSYDCFRHLKQHFTEVRG